MNALNNRFIRILEILFILIKTEKRDGRGEEGGMHREKGSGKSFSWV